MLIFALFFSAACASNGFIPMQQTNIPAVYSLGSSHSSGSFLSFADESSHNYYATQIPHYVAQYSPAHLQTVYIPNYSQQPALTSELTYEELEVEDGSTLDNQNINSIGITDHHMAKLKKLACALGGIATLLAILSVILILTLSPHHRF